MPRKTSQEDSRKVSNIDGSGSRKSSHGGSGGEITRRVSLVPPEGATEGTHGRPRRQGMVSPPLTDIPQGRRLSRRFS